MFSDLTILGNLIASRSTWGQRKTRRCWPLSCEVLRVEETCALEVGRLGGHGISLKVGNPCLEGNRLEPGVSKLQLASENLQLPAGFNQHILVTYDYPFLTHRHNTMHFYVGNVVMLMGRVFLPSKFRFFVSLMLAGLQWTLKNKYASIRFIANHQTSTFQRVPIKP